MSELYLEKVHPDWRTELAGAMTNLETGAKTIVNVLLFHPDDTDVNLDDEPMAEFKHGTQHDVLNTIADYLARKNDTVARIKLRYNAADPNGRFKVIFCRLTPPSPPPTLQPLV